jgi:hypothetical protein
MKYNTLPATDYDLWQDGELRDQEFLDRAARRLASLQDNLEPLQATEKIIRSHISIVVDRMGGKANVPGFASFVITEAGLTVTYDSSRLDKLVAALISEGNIEMAQRLTACRKEGSRSGSLRITKARANANQEEPLLDL